MADASPSADYDFCSPLLATAAHEYACMCVYTYVADVAHSTWGGMHTVK